MKKKSIPVVQIQGITAEDLLHQIKEDVKDLISKLEAKDAKEAKTEKLLSRKEVCKLLQISLVTVHNWTKRGILNPYRIGNKLRFKEKEVLEALTPVNLRETNENIKK